MSEAATKNHGWQVTLAGLGINLALGVLYSWSVIAGAIKEAGWGWSLWNFRGGFGILDSNRQGARYEDYYGHQLDREMLKLLQKF